MVDTGHRVVRVRDMTGTDRTILDLQGKPGAFMAQVRHPSGIFVDRAGRIYVINLEGCVRVGDMTGIGWTTLGFRCRGRAGSSWTGQAGFTWWIGHPESTTAVLCA